MEKEKLIDYLFAQNEKLNAQLAGVREELRLQREQSAEQHRGLTAQLSRMEERTISAEKRADAAERRADAESMARAESDKRVAELTSALTAALDGSVLKDLKAQIAMAEKERDDAKSSDRQSRSDLYGAKSQKMKRASKDEKPPDDDDDRDAGVEKADMGAPQYPLSYMQG